MNHRTIVQKLLKQSNFKLIRRSKHLIYRNNKGMTIVVPHHKRMNEYTFRTLIKEITKGGEK